MSPEIDPKAGPRTGDDPQVDPRPERTEVQPLQATETSKFDDHEVDDEEHVEHRADQLVERVED